MSDNPFTLIDELPASSYTDRVDILLRQFADALRANPGKWGEWPKPQARGSAHSTGFQIRKGIHGSFPGGEFDATARQGKLYVRYVGGVQ